MRGRIGFVMAGALVMVPVAAVAGPQVAARVAEAAAAVHTPVAASSSVAPTTGMGHPAAHPAATTAVPAKLGSLSPLATGGGTVRRPAITTISGWTTTPWSAAAGYTRPVTLRVVTGTGKAAATPRRTVLVQRRAATSGRWATVAKGITSPTGRFTTQLGAPTTGRYVMRVVVAGTRTMRPASTLPRSVSGTTGTTTRIGGWPTSSLSVRAGAQLLVPVSVQTGVRALARPVQLHLLAPGAKTWRVAATGMTSGRGALTLRTPVSTSTGTWSARLVLPATATTRSVISATRGVQVTSRWLPTVVAGVTDVDVTAFDGATVVGTRSGQAVAYDVARGRLDTLSGLAALGTPGAPVVRSAAYGVSGSTVVGTVDLGGRSAAYRYDLVSRTATRLQPDAESADATVTDGTWVAGQADGRGYLHRISDGSTVDLGEGVRPVAINGDTVVGARASQGRTQAVSYLIGERRLVELGVLGGEQAEAVALAGDRLLARVVDRTGAESAVLAAVTAQGASGQGTSGQGTSGQWASGAPNRPLGPGFEPVGLTGGVLAANNQATSRSVIRDLATGATDWLDLPAGRTGGIRVRAVAPGGAAVAGVVLDRGRSTLALWRRS